jgi:ribonuclease HII
MLSAVCAAPHPLASARFVARTMTARADAGISAAVTATRPFARRRASLFPPVIGCDEVGRGALCGPVVVCAVWFDPCALPKGLLGRLDDSKRIDRDEREALFPLIRNAARVSFAARSARYIDVYNIRNATLQAMQQAVTRLGIQAPVRIDGIDVPRGLSGDARAVIKGDGKVPQIAAASILAKVMRDRLMARLATRHDHYRWEQNSGYGTRAHRDAIVLHGHTRHHRCSFGDLFSAPPPSAPMMEVAALA